MAAGPVSRLGSFEPGDKTGLRLSPHLAPSTIQPGKLCTYLAKIPNPGDHTRPSKEGEAHTGSMMTLFATVMAISSCSAFTVLSAVPYHAAAPRSEADGIASLSMMCAPAETPARGGGRSARGRGGRGGGGGGGGRGRGGRGGGRAAPGGGAPRTVRYITEVEMQTEVLAAAKAQGFDDGQAAMLSACGRNIYAIGCEYHANTATLLQELCKEPAGKGEAWALVLLRCLSGQMPRLRSNDAARVRIEAAAAAAARRKRLANKS